ncbi:MAG: hypothetical protein OEL56_00640 [Nitrosopumilus sp.]|nr:hypothetical protein [Nitrosopumilus sp.]MDH3515383.1 hypothetical protein [Nitrosopumilus sp.]MDH3564316.1 hypothetical protein [Nitrosopumilus sp.]MDH5417199.1 hypothetical protein [Nitrosopumilus sp.]MDH5555014.1 hypothetical protein [Nitrosopumilus sp.]
MVKCLKCGNTKWSRGISITITDDYLKVMKKNILSYKYGKEYSDWPKVYP